MFGEKMHKFRPPKCNVVFLRTEELPYDHSDQPQSACGVCPPHIEAYFCRNCMVNPGVVCSLCQNPRPQCVLGPDSMATPDDTPRQNDEWDNLDSTIDLDVCQYCGCLACYGHMEDGEIICDDCLEEDRGY